MILQVYPTERLQGRIAIPASKSHTIRAVLLAALAEGTSVLHRPLLSEDTRAVLNACRALGAVISEFDDRIEITGFDTKPVQPAEPLDMLNSGTSTNLTLGVLAALGLQADVTGDASLQSRPVKALTDALQGLGCTTRFHASDGCPPLSISGRMQGGTVELDASKSSQYVSSLLLACPLGRLHVLIPDFESGGVQGIHLLRLDDVSGSLEPAGSIVFKGLVSDETGEYLLYRERDTDGTLGGTVHGPVTRDPSRPDAIQLEFWFKNELPAGWFKVTTYNEAGASPPSATQAFVAGGT